MVITLKATVNPNPHKRLMQNNVGKCEVKLETRDLVKEEQIQVPPMKLHK